MPVVLTAPAEGLQPGATYTGPREAWLLSNGYASQDGYTGPGVANTGALTSVLPADDPNLAENREAPGDQVIAITSDLPFKGVNDGVETGQAKQQPPLSGTDPVLRTPEGPASDLTVTPNTGAAAGGTVVTVKHQGADDTTGVTFGGVAGTAFTKVDDETVEVTTPAHTAGAVDVVVQDADGNETKVGGFTYQ